MSLNDKLDLKIKELTKYISNNEQNNRIDNDFILVAKEILSLNKQTAKVNSNLAESKTGIIKYIKQLTHYYNQQKEFTSLLSHELRGSIQAILGFTEILELNPIDSKEYIDKIKENAERLNTLVLDILDLTKIENNLFTFNIMPINLNDIIVSAIEEITQKIKYNKKKINLVFPYNSKNIRKLKENDIINKDYNDYTNIIVLGNRQRITQVMLNVLDNAIKFTKEGEIWINIEKKDADNVTINPTNPIINNNNNNKNSNENDNKKIKKEIVVVSIKDSGKGIDSKVFPNLFSKFISEQGTGGTGLGLFISKNIIQAHGGNMWTKNNTDRTGATFYFSLPLSR